jgi:hypothetical protein
MGFMALGTSSAFIWFMQNQAVPGFNFMAFKAKIVSIAYQGNTAVTALLVTGVALTIFSGLMHNNLHHCRVIRAMGCMTEHAFIFYGKISMPADKIIIFDIMARSAQRCLLLQEEWREFRLMRFMTGRAAFRHRLVHSRPEKTRPIMAFEAGLFPVSAQKGRIV